MDTDACLIIPVEPGVSLSDAAAFHLATKASLAVAATPRTDAQPPVEFYDDVGTQQDSSLVSRDFARTLELETAELNQRLVAAERERDALRAEAQGIEDALDAAGAPSVRPPPYEYAMHEGMKDVERVQWLHTEKGLANARLIAIQKVWKEKTDALNQRVQELESALRKITQIHWGYDGDCGAVRIAEDVLSEPPAQALSPATPKEPDRFDINDPNFPTPEPGLAIFHGAGGWPEEQERAASVLEAGKVYKVIGGSMGQSHTSLKLEGVEGMWNSALFNVDIFACPIPSPYHHSAVPAPKPEEPWGKEKV